MTVATHRYSCNAGLGSQIRHLSLQTGWEKKENSPRKYLSTMSHLILEIQTMRSEGYSVMDGSWTVEDG